MLKVNYEYIWKFLRENDGEMLDNFTSGMLCTICRKVMINPHIGQCGCKYCLTCVTDCLNRDRKFCPGNVDDFCKVQLMVIGETVVQDNAMNLDISKLKVECPRNSCNFTGELRRMEEHERLCRNPVVMCPYCDIGCQEKQLANDKIDGHLTDENESHAKLLMDCIGRLQNEILSMKNDIIGLKEERREHQVVVQRMDREMHALKEENRSMKEVINSLQSVTQSNGESVSDMRGLVETQARDIKQLSKNCLERDDRVRQLEIANEKGGWSTHDDEGGKGQAKEGDIAIPMHRKWINVENRVRGEFVWLIDDWAARRQAARNEWIERKREAQSGEDVGSQAVKDPTTKTRIFSDTFYLHEYGYRMSLSIWPDGYCDDSNNLLIVWRLVRGPFDEHLLWPFRGSVTISIMDQETRLDFTSFTLTSDQYLNDHRLNKPTTERNFGFANLKPINVEEILRNPAVWRNDQMLIKCVVSVLQ